MTTTLPELARLLRAGAIDAELAALVWILAEGGLPIHVAAALPDEAAAVARSLEDLVRPVHVLDGDSLEAVLAATIDEPALLGVVIVVRGARVVAAHWVRPSLRDGAGHLRAQGPAVLSTWDERMGAYEHFAWGVIPELAAIIGMKAGDFEIDFDGRRDRVNALAGAHPN